MKSFNDVVGVEELGMSNGREKLRIKRRRERKLTDQRERFEARSRKARGDYDRELAF